MRTTAARLLVAVGLCVGVLACGEDSEEPLVAEEIIRLKSDQVLIGLDHYVTAEGLRKAHLLADTAYFLENQSSVELRDVRVTFFEKDGRPSSTLTSREGTYNWNTGDMVAKKDVVVVDPELGRTIETSVMNYDRLRDRIWSDMPTTVTEEDGTVIEGTAFESDASLEEVDLTSARVVKPGAQRDREP